MMPSGSSGLGGEVGTGGLAPSAPRKSGRAGCCLGCAGTGRDLPWWLLLSGGMVWGQWVLPAAIS